MSKQRRLHLIQGDLYKSQKSCEALDTANGVEAPPEAESWFWPARPKPEGEEDEQESEKQEEELEIEPEDQLKLVTQYLRMEYQYCLWCGTRFKDSDDLNANCPGDTREDHDE